MSASVSPEPAAARPRLPSRSGRQSPRWLQRLRQRWGRRKAGESGSSPRPVALVVRVVESTRYVFGLDWRMVPPSRRLGRVFSMAREEGQVWYALSDMEDVVGFANAPRWVRGPHFSAPLQLAAGHSQGGVELFVLVFADDLVAVVGLQESRPLPGFDQLVTLAQARTLVEDFLAIQRGQPIRLVGNADWLEGIEAAMPEDLLAEPAKTARIAHLSSARVLRAALLAAVCTGLLAWAGVYYVDDQREKTRNELAATPGYQQQQYQDSLQPAWRALPPRARWAQQQWYAVISRLPLQIQGWRLGRAVCNVEHCMAYWRRLYGSYADFLAQVPQGADAVEEVVRHEQPLAGEIMVRFKLGSAPAAEYLALSQLPQDKPGQRQIIDRLQEWSLLSPHNSRLEPLVLFGGSQNPALLGKAIFSGAWVFESALWTLPLLNLPDFLVLTELLVRFEPEADSSGKPAADEGNGKAAVPIGTPSYRMTGTYYVEKRT